MKQIRVKITERHKYLISYLADYSCVKTEELNALLQVQERTKTQVIADLNKLGYIAKSKIKIKNSRADLTSENAKRIRAARESLEKMEHISELLAEESSGIYCDDSLPKLFRKCSNTLVTSGRVLRSALKILGRADWEGSEPEYSEIYTVYRLTEKGKKYAASLGYAPKDLNVSKSGEMTRLVKISSIATQLKKENVFESIKIEVLPSHYPSGLTTPIGDNILFVPGHEVKRRMATMYGDDGSDIRKFVRVAGVLCGQKQSYSIYYAGNNKVKFITKNELTILDKVYIEGTPPVKGLIVLNSSYDNFDKVEKVITRTFVNEDRRYDEIHMLVNDGTAGHIMAALCLRDWCNDIIKATFPDVNIDFNPKKMWGQADALVSGKYVFNMISHETMRNAILLWLAQTAEKLNNVIILCHRSQMGYYCNQDRYPGATVVPSAW